MIELKNSSHAGEEMIYECCDKQKIRFEIESWYSILKTNEKLIIEILKCPELKNTYDLRINKEKR